MTTTKPLIASYMKRDETPGPVIMAVSVGARDIATAEMPDALPGHDDPDTVLAELGYRPAGRWRHTNLAARVAVEPTGEGIG